MQLQDFVEGIKKERDAIFASYADRDRETRVGALLAQANLSESQREAVLAALDTALTDAFYTVLLGLDGAASLGGRQQSYQIQDEDGHLVSSGDGELEALAFELFQEA